MFWVLASCLRTISYPAVPERAAHQETGSHLVFMLPLRLTSGLQEGRMCKACRRSLQSPGYAKNVIKSSRVCLNQQGVACTELLGCLQQRPSSMNPLVCQQQAVGSRHLR